MQPSESTGDDPTVTGSVNTHEHEQLLETVAAAQHISHIKATVQSLREKAAQAASPQERERLLQEAYDGEIEAHGSESKLAKRLRSGTWQGLAGGAGIGGGIGVGLGAVVGTVLGGVLAIPTTGLGALVGSGLGALHGPFITLKADKDDGEDVEEKRWDELSPERIVAALEQESGTVDEGPRGADASEGIQARDPSRPPDKDVRQSDRTERRKPRKLEIRSQPSSDTTCVKRVEKERKPRKLEVRQHMEGRHGREGSPATKHGKSGVDLT